MLIRTATESDIQSIAQLHAESWKQSYRGMLSDDYLDNLVDQERLDCWQQRLTNPTEGQYILLAEENNQLVGFICIFLHANPQWGTLIDNLHVRPNVKGKGIGKVLMKEISQWLLKNNHNEAIYLWVLEKNIPAQKFYDHIQGQNCELCLVPVTPALGGQLSHFRYAWENPAALLAATV